MKVKIIRPTIAQKRAVGAGEVLEVSRVEAINLVGAGKAIILPDAPETASAPVETAEKAVAPAPEKPVAGKKKKE